MADGIVKPDEGRLRWIASHLYIITKSGEHKLLTPNVVQLKLHMAMQAQRCRGLPVRLRLLKARQFGCSTWIEAEGFYEVYHNKNWRAMAVSVDADSTDHIFGMTKMFEEEMPAVMRMPKDNTNRKEIKWSRPHRSQFLAQTAGKFSLGRSFTIQYLHDSEIAFWENAAAQKSGLEEVVPLKPGTTIVDETTANGQGGWFYDSWMEDIHRHRRSPDEYSGYLPLFFPWFIFPEYAVEPPKGFGFNKDERDIQKQFKLTDAQLYWRRLKLDSKNGDVALLMQEFPATWQEAFQASGNPVFSPEIIALQARHEGKSFRRVLFDSTSGKPSMVNTDEFANIWLINKDVQDDRDYAVGVDTMEGRVSDINNPKSSLDYDGVTVLDRSTGECVAVYHGRGDQRELAEQVFRAALYYNEAYVGPEIPQSMVLLNYFKEHGYPYLYNRRKHEDRDTDEESEQLGWRTTAITRKWLVEDMVVALKDGSVKLVFPELIDEMRTFCRDKNGKPQHLPGEHDDLLISAMIALQVHKNCPLTNSHYGAEHTDEEPNKPGPDEDDRLARVGAVDTWNPEIGDEDEEDYYEVHTE